MCVLESNATMLELLSATCAVRQIISTGTGILKFVMEILKISLHKFVLRFTFNIST